MGSTLEHGIYLPSEGEKNCYQGLAGNWNKVDGALGDVAELKQLIESKFTKEIVTELPTEDINPYCIYMILKTDPETNNIYDEWVYINNAWEYLGNTQVDMTQYYTKQEVNQLPAVASGVTSTKVGNYDAHIANGDIHVTASDKSKWNTVALIKQLRLVNTQVGSATTIAFANIDDTNGIKVGDKCMDLDGRMFEITAVDTANQTVTVGTALIDLALDANVMHLSGNETVAGIKKFIDYTYIKALNFTNEVASPSSSGSAAMPIVVTVTYTDSSPSQSARLNFRISADGTKSLYPHENNQYALGLQSRKWSEVRAVQYYYGSSDVEFSNKFVTTDTVQAIDSKKTFNNIVPINGAYIGNEPSTSFRTVLLLRSRYDTDDKSGWLVSKFRSNSAQGQLSGSDTVFLTFDVLENEVRTNGILRFTLSSWSGNTPGRFSLIPNSAIESYLGTQGNKWAAINGINPGSLSMPDLNNGIDISSYITLPNTHNTYTPSVNGWISIILKSTSGALGLFIYQGDLSSSQYSSTSLPNESEPCVMCCLPVVGNRAVSIDTKGSNAYLVSAKFYPCQGNV